MLARTVAHTTDVDGMLSQMTPQQFDEWLAMFCIRPWGVEITAPEQEEKSGGSLDAFRAMAGF